MFERAMLRRAGRRQCLVECAPICRLFHHLQTPFSPYVMAAICLQPFMSQMQATGIALHRKVVYTSMDCHYPSVISGSICMYLLYSVHPKTKAPATIPILKRQGVPEVNLDERRLTHVTQHSWHVSD
jgi:hypothetical protein